VTRTTRVAAAAASGLLGVLLTAGPALAMEIDEGYGEAEVGLTGALVLYGLLPLAILVGFGLLVWLPNVVRGDRYRPAKGWSAPPLWFAGPPEPEAAVESASVGDVVRGGSGGSW
jgi:nitrate reductase NapE component